MVSGAGVLCALSTQVSLVTLDLSFISVLKVMPALAAVMAPGAQMVVLIKPQFEAGRAQVGAGGLVKDPQASMACVFQHVTNDNIPASAAACWG
jgi:predicted rRNA methylase YqxC with S4 and FtsJ domains